MKIQVETASITVDKKILIVGYEVGIRRKPDIILSRTFEINSKDSKNYIYIRNVLKKLPWTNKCRTWGEVIKNLPGRQIQLQKSYLINN